MSDQNQRRRAPRADLPLLVQYRFSALDDFRTVYTQNISASGVLLATQDVRPVGTPVWVLITTRDGRQLLQGEGKVVRHATGGHAIELVGFDEDAQRALTALVEQELQRRADGEQPRARPRRKRSQPIP